MIHPVTCVCMAIFAGSGLYLYQAKHGAELETREIYRLRGEAEKTVQRTAVMATEYQREIDPDRLRDLATRFQPQLKETAPGQFTTIEDFPKRLPPIGLPVPPAQAPAEADLVYNFPPAPAPAASAPADEKPTAASRVAGNAAPKTVVASADAAAARPAARPAVHPPVRDLNAAYVPPGDGMPASAPIRQASSAISAASSTAAAGYGAPYGYGNGQPNSALGSRTSAPAYASRNQPGVPYAPVMAVPHSYAPQQYRGQNVGQYQNQYQPAPAQGGGSALGMARPTYQGAQYQYVGIGNGG